MTWNIQIKNYRCFSDTSPLKIDLKNSVTALIGPNNSGKTAALRFFWEVGAMVAQAPGALPNGLRQPGPIVISESFRSITNSHAMFHNENDRPIVIDLNQNEVPNIFDENLYPAENFRPVHLRLKIDRQNLSTQMLHIHNGKEYIDISQEFRGSSHGGAFILRTHESEICYAIENGALGLIRTATYIPSSRSYGRISNDDNYDLILGREIVNSWNETKGSDIPQAQKYAKMMESEICRIFGFKNIDIFANNTKTDLLVKIDNNHTIPIRDMGDGVSHILTTIINTMTRGSTLVLLDEPELGMHASLQIEVMNLIAKFSDGPIIFATHSIGLARSVADEIISFRIKDGSSISQRFESSSSYLETLGELSFSAWREIGCDGVLFVEGPTDVKVISEWLKKLRLINKWAVMSLGGSTSIDSDGVELLKQVLSVHKKIAVIIDRDNPEENHEPEAKRLKFQEDCRKVDVPCHITKLRATDNYFSSDVLDRAIGQAAIPLEPFEKLVPHRHGWSKRQAVKIASEMRREEIEATDIGQFLLSLRTDQ